MRGDSRPAAHRRIVFIGGLHRSGTSLVHRCIARHPDVTGFLDTGAPEDEGQHLQTVYPPASRYGGPGRFAFDRRAHLTESSPLVSAASRTKLLEEWGRYWNADSLVCVEKSPPNMVRMRFLQALFPESAFVMVIRHPVAVACATQKWSRAPWTSFVHHWSVAHNVMMSDARSVSPVIVVRYEDFVAEPERTLNGTYVSLGLSPYPPGEEVCPEVNERYFVSWRRGRNPLRVLDRSVAALRFESAARRFGYSLRGTATLARPAHADLP